MPDTAPGQPVEKLLTSSATHPYETLNVRTSKTRQVWVVFHGIGYLSRYFLRFFSHLDPADNYIIAPQAPSLYYLDPAYRNVGASWLTREHTERNMENLLRYLDALCRAESLDECPDMVLMGFSQGVSVLCRWVALRRVSCSRLLLFSGRVPPELGPADFEHLPHRTPVEVYVGAEDPFLPEGERPAMEARLRELFGQRLQLTVHPGGHELRSDLIRA